MITTAALIIGGVVLVIVLLGIAAAVHCAIQAEREEVAGERIALSLGLAKPFKPLYSDRHHRRPDMWHPDRTGDNRP